MRVRFAVLIVVAGGLLAGCGSGAAHPSVTPTSGTTSTTGTTTTTEPATEPVGGYYTWTGGLGVELLRVEDPATPANSFESAPAGSRLVAVELSIWSFKGSQTDDANSTTAIQGSNGQVYSPSFDDVAGCTDFNYGTFNVTAGDPHEVGCVVFEVPDGVKVTTVTYTPQGGFDTSGAGVWKI